MQLHSSSLSLSIFYKTNVYFLSLYNPTNVLYCSNVFILNDFISTFSPLYQTTPCRKINIMFMVEFFYGCFFNFWSRLKIFTKPFEVYFMLKILLWNHTSEKIPDGKVTNLISSSNMANLLWVFWVISW